MQWIIENPVFDSSQIDALSKLSSSVSVKVSSSALAILLANEIVVYNEPYSVIDFTKKSDPARNKEERHYESRLFVTPNPAKEFLTIKYECDTPASSMMFYNKAGKLILTKYLYKQIDEVTINIQSFKPGIYLIVLNSTQGLIESTKFVITK